MSYCEKWDQEHLPASLESLAPSCICILLM